ncbi:MAG: hypothetical protein MJE68_31915, partial [Proteobacteria bacterium]|nr:hypothetical protein [Pseudomonadota bacterium]
TTHAVQQNVGHAGRVVCCSISLEESFMCTCPLSGLTKYIWSKISPDEIDHIELCNISGIHFDVIADLEGKQCSMPPTISVS